MRPLIVFLATALLPCSLSAADAPEQKPAPGCHSTFTVQKDGHGQGRDLVVISWKTRTGAEAGTVMTPVSGLGRIGPVSIRLAAVGDDPNASEWDTREWQWWKGFSRPFSGGDDKYARHVPATGGAEMNGPRIRVWARYVSDQVETVQEWFFDDLDRPDQAAYDCLITIRNLGREPLEEYGQFFASYTAWNEERGHFFWDEDGTLANFSDRGGTHLDFYVTAKGSPFDKLGRIPHCARGGGKIRAVWRHPAIVSQPGPSGHRHIVLCEEARTAGVAQGMSGVAQDYILFPPGGTLRAGASFSAHVRHLLVKPAADESLAKELEAWWNAFAEDHERVHKLSQAAGE